MAFKGDQYIWTDRKRFWGMPLSFTRYALSDDRLFLSVGCINITDEEILLYRIRDISLKRSLWQRICKVGTITVVSSDKSAPSVRLKNIKNPFEVKELIHSSVEEIKEKRRVRISEMLDNHDGHGVPPDFGEPDDFDY